MTEDRRSPWGHTCPEGRRCPPPDWSHPTLPRGSLSPPVALPLSPAQGILPACSSLSRLLVDFVPSLPPQVRRHGLLLGGIHTS